jgi:hypothetical protein
LPNQTICSNIRAVIVVPFKAASGEDGEMAKETLYNLAAPVTDEQYLDFVANEKGAVRAQLLLVI